LKILFFGKYVIIIPKMKRWVFTMGMKKTLYDEARLVISEIAEAASLKSGQILVIGCSTSEIVGEKIGTNSAPEVAREVFGAFYEYAREKEIYLAVQCCEHLNRAIVIERRALPFAEEVNVVPQPKAGGSLATAAYAKFENPVAVEEIKADAGIDIGFTLIGMHLKKVAVPLRLENNRIGEALVLAARTRPKFIGGVRAKYDEDML
jgi:uncharacterized protein (TIGR01440 family)